MKILYKHVHLIIDDKREYLDGSILINDKTIEDVFIQSNRKVEDAKEVDMQGKIFIPAFFDSKSKKDKQKGVVKRFVASNELLNEDVHLISDGEIIENRNICAVTRIYNYKKVNSIKTLINPSSEENKFADAVSDITKEQNINLNSNRMINYAFANNCFVEFGIDNNIKDEYIKFVLKNIEVNNIILISYEHDDIINQVKRLRKLNVSYQDIAAMTSINPYSFYGYNRQDGYLIKGKPANIVCLDERDEIEFTIIEGEKHV
ncbi:MAG: hypothetical protein Q4P14_04890 [Methanobacteriaceae archaeon]|nr:hypothetical protein [Methanobacteriaceae archaeon]